MRPGVLRRRFSREKSELRLGKATDLKQPRQCAEGRHVNTGQGSFCRLDWRLPVSESCETCGSSGKAYRVSVALPPYQLGRAYEKSLSGPQAAGFSPHSAERLIISRKRPLMITLLLPKTVANCLPAHSTECQTSIHIFNPHRKACNVHQSLLSLYQG